MTLHSGSGHKNEGYDGDHDAADKQHHKDSITNNREKVKLARSEKWRILKNITTISFAFMVQFTAFQGMYIQIQYHHIYNNTS